MKKKKLNAEDHKKIGKVIRILAIAIGKLNCVAHSHLAKNHLVCRKINQSLKNLNSAKISLSNELVKEFPEIDDVKIYYGVNDEIENEVNRLLREIIE